MLLVVVAAGCTRRDYCGAPPDGPAAAAAYGLRRDGETLAAMATLGLRRAADVHESDIFLLGYPNLGLTPIAGAAAPWTGDATHLHRTYAEDGDGSTTTCNGDFHYLLAGDHAELTASALAGDIDALLALAQPSDVYTHAAFDGHPDHAQVFDQLAAALERSGRRVRLHSTLMHPEGSGGCMGLSAARWPNPPLANGDPFARFTPALDVTPPPIPACSPEPAGASWGPLGPPDELVEVPAEMQDGDPSRNLKWQVIAKYASQIECVRRQDSSYPASCGYMRAFVKRHEFFWTRRFGGAGHEPGTGPVLVVAAHPDDEALGAAGIIARARAAGRRVLVAVVTNGDSYASSQPQPR